MRLVVLADSGKHIVEFSPDKFKGILREYLQKGDIDYAFSEIEKQIKKELLKI